MARHLLGLKLTIHLIKSKIPLVRLSLSCIFVLSKIAKVFVDTLEKIDQEQRSEL